MYTKNAIPVCNIYPNIPTYVWFVYLCFLTYLYFICTIAVVTTTNIVTKTV